MMSSYPRHHRAGETPALQWISALCSAGVSPALRPRTIKREGCSRGFGKRRRSRRIHGASTVRQLRFRQRRDRSLRLGGSVARLGGGRDLHCGGRCRPRSRSRCLHRYDRGIRREQTLPVYDPPRDGAETVRKSDATPVIVVPQWRRVHTFGDSQPNGGRGCQCRGRRGSAVGSTRRTTRES